MTKVTENKLVNSTGDVNIIQTDTNATPKKADPVPVGGENAETKPLEMQKKVKAEDLDYSNFPRKFRYEASEFARAALNEVEDLARQHNNNFKEGFFIEYDSFPRPENFDSKNFGGNERAYNAWKDSVKDWVQTSKEQIQVLEQKGLQNLEEKIEVIIKKLAEGVFQEFEKLGITQEEILKLAELANGNINTLKALLNRRASEIIKITNQQADSLHEHIDDESYSTRTLIIEENTKTRMDINKESQAIQNTVKEEGQYTRNIVEEDGNHTRYDIKKATKKIQQTEQDSVEIAGLSDSISSHLVCDDEHNEKTYQRVEDLKNKIIASDRITHDKKIELLKKLLELVIKDNWITEGNLENILKEVTTIQL